MRKRIFSFLFIMGLFCTSIIAFGDMTVAYRGINTVHLKFQTSFSCTSVRLSVSGPDGNRIIKEYPVADIYNVNVSDTIRDTDLRVGTFAEPVTYTYKLEGYWPSLNGYTTIAETDAVLDGDLAGNLEFDETIDGEALKILSTRLVCSVPVGKKLTISNINVNSFYATNYGIQGTLDVRNCTASHWELKKVKNVSFQDCKFLSLEIQGGEPVLNGCEIATGVYGSVILRNRTAATFHDCIFSCPIEFRDDNLNADIPKWAQSGPSPTIEGNSFVGQQAFDTFRIDFASNLTKVQIGSNYYGDPKGPVTNQTDSVTFFTRGANIPDGMGLLNLAPHSTSGKFPSDKRLFPKIWVNRSVIGQGTLNYGTSVILPDKETAVCLDVVTAAESMAGVNFYAILKDDKGSRTVEPTNPAHVLHRSLAAYGPFAADSAKSTLNFILPPATGVTATVEIWADPSGVTGYEATAPAQMIYTQSVAPAAKPLRKLRIVILPVVIGLPGYDHGTPSAHRVKSWLDTLMPAMLPIRSQDLDIRVAAPYNYSGNLFGSLSTTVMLNALSTYLAIAQGIYNVENPPFDFVVAVVAPGNLGAGNEGVSMTARRGVVFVDADKPDAVIHELGHAIGLATGTEQYDEYPDFGRPLDNVTTFISDNSKYVPNFDRGDSGRILHHPSVNGVGYDLSSYWTDVMGNGGFGAHPTWPDPGTFLAFDGYFRSHMATASSVRKQTPKVAMAGYKQILVQAAIERMDLPTTVTVYPYRLREGTIRVMETGNLPEPMMPPNDYNMIGDQYDFQVFAPGGYMVANEQFGVTNRSPGNLYPEVDMWRATFMISDDRAGYRIVRKSDGKILVSVGQGEIPQTQITSPAPGSQIAGQVDLRWSDSAKTGNRVYSDGPAVPATTLQHTILASTDSGATWSKVADFVEGDSWSGASDFLAQNQNVIFRVLTSDGFSSSETSVNNLKVTNHPPRASILSPANGLVVTPGTALDLAAQAYDIEDGPLTSGTWTSSVKGILGKKTCLYDTVLPVGNHILTFNTIDSALATTSTQVLVNVTSKPVIDLGLTTNSLRVTQPGRDPLNSLPTWLEINSTHTATLVLNPAPVATTATLALYITPPGGTEKRLTYSILTLPALTSRAISARFIPAKSGTWRFRGKVQGILPSDAKSTNNQFIWQIATQSPAQIEMDHWQLDFGPVLAGSTSAPLTVKVRNKGQTPLNLKRVAIQGMNSNYWMFNGSNQQSASIPENGEVSIEVLYHPMSNWRQQAELFIESNDLLRPASSIPLLGGIGTYKTQVSPQNWMLFE